MAKTARRLMGMVMCAALLTVSRVETTVVQVVGEDVPMASAGTNSSGERGFASARVRTDSSVLAAMIQDAAERSKTFRYLMDSIQVSDGVVYVERGRCRHYVRACLALSVAVAGPNRILRVVVDDRKEEAEVIPAVAHELRHALEILAEPSVTNADAMYFFYKRQGLWQGQAFETRAAIDAGNAVRKELRKR